MGRSMNSHNHPRAWGSMPRFLGHYVRDLHLLPLPEAVRKITSMPARTRTFAEAGIVEAGILMRTLRFSIRRRSSIRPRTRRQIKFQKACIMSL